jgi:hypothetical protein
LVFREDLLQKLHPYQLHKMSQPPPFKKKSSNNLDYPHNQSPFL